MSVSVEDRWVRQVVEAIEDRLPAQTWPFEPRTYGYPGSLALCVIDAIQSMGVRYGGVKNVVARYRAARTEVGGHADSDGMTDLVDSFAAAGGPDGWARSVGNGQRAWSRATAPLKAQVILAAAQMLAARGVDSCDDFIRCRDTSAETSAEVEAGWLSLPGQRSGISWRYLQMLAGVPGVKPDRMVRRFIASCGVPTAGLSADDLATLLTAAADSMEVSPTALDQVVWLYQSGRLTRTADA